MYSSYLNKGNLTLKEACFIFEEAEKLLSSSDSNDNNMSANEIISKAQLAGNTRYLAYKEEVKAKEKAERAKDPGRMLLQNEIDKFKKEYDEFKRLSGNVEHDITAIPDNIAVPEWMLRITSAFRISESNLLSRVLIQIDPQTGCDQWGYPVKSPETRESYTLEKMQFIFEEAEKLLLSESLLSVDAIKDRAKQYGSSRYDGYCKEIRDKRRELEREEARIALKQKRKAEEEKKRVQEEERQRSIHLSSFTGVKNLVRVANGQGKYM